MHFHRNNLQTRLSISRQARYIRRRDARYHFGTSETGRPSRHEELWRKAHGVTRMVPCYMDHCDSNGNILWSRYIGHKRVAA